MALSDARPVRSLLEDEDGSAVVEFVILLPVYLLLITGLFSLGEMSMAYQALAMASRHDAWTAGDLPDQSIDDAFFGPYSGTYASETMGGGGSRDPFQMSDLRAQPGEPNVGPRARKIALAMLNNSAGQGGGEFQKHAIRATFTYDGVLIGAQQLTFTSEPVCYLPNPDYERAEHQDGQQEHFIADRSLDPPFDPAAREDRYLAPKFGRFRRDGDEPGIWSPDARIGGGPEQEWSYYRGRVR